MAQFMNQPTPEPFETAPGSGFDAMGKPIPFYRRQAGYEHCVAMGLGKEEAFRCVEAVSDSLARDEPHDAMGKGMKWLDLTGTYRLFAVLLTAEVVGVKHGGRDEVPETSSGASRKAGSSGEEERGRSKEKKKAQSKTIGKLQAKSSTRRRPR